MTHNAGLAPPRQLFHTTDHNPLSPDHRPEVLVEDQGGTVREALGSRAPATGAYLKAASGNAPVAVAAPKFSEEKSVRIKREYPLELFAQQHLTPGRRRDSGNVKKYVCPWHVDDDKNPNLDVYLPGHKKYGSCHCYRCGEGGSVIDLAMVVFGAEAGEAMRLIEGKSAYDESRRQAYVEKAKRFEDVERPEINTPEHIHTFALMAAERIQSDPQVIRYLASRGLGGAVRMFHLGSSFSLPQGAIPQKIGDDGQVIPHKNFLGRLVIPYLTPDGIIACVNARALDERQPKYLKPSGVDRRPYYLDNALEEGEDVVMCEGELDAISLMLALKADPIGIFATPGIHCFGEEDAAKLTGRRVFIVTDNDGAGSEGREKLSELIYGYARTVYHIEVKREHNDLNAMLVAEGRRYVKGWFDACIREALKHGRRVVWYA